MPRQTYAAEQLAADVQEWRKSAKVEIDGEPDGIGVYRSVKFDKATSKVLAPIIEVIAATDDRIVASEIKDHLTVTFDAGPVADDRTPFPIKEAEDALNE